MPERKPLTFPVTVQSLFAEYFKPVIDVDFDKLGCTENEDFSDSCVDSLDREDIISSINKDYGVDLRIERCKRRARPDLPFFCLANFADEVNNQHKRQLTAA